MSQSAAERVWEQSAATDSAFVLALALAHEVRWSRRFDDASRQGFELPVCWVSKRRLALRIRRDERTVDRSVDQLAGLGELRVVESRHLAPRVARWLQKAGRSNLYLLTVGLDPAVADALVVYRSETTGRWTLAEVDGGAAGRQL